MNSTATTVPNSRRAARTLGVLAILFLGVQAIVGLSTPADAAASSSTVSSAQDDNAKSGASEEPSSSKRHGPPSPKAAVSAMPVESTGSSGSSRGTGAQDVVARLGEIGSTARAAGRFGTSAGQGFALAAGAMAG